MQQASNAFAQETSWADLVNVEDLQDALSHEELIRQEDVDMHRLEVGRSEVRVFRRVAQEGDEYAQLVIR